MYKIIGADGREYGPVSAEQLRQWMVNGRVNAQTLTQLVGSTEWKPLGSFPEFIPTTPPTVAVSPLAAPPARTTVPTTNSMAVAGLAFGLLGLIGCCGMLFSTLGVVFSSVGLSQIKHNPVQETGRAIAMAGLVLSILGVVKAVVLMVVFGTMGLWGHHPMFWHRQWQF